MTSCIEVFNDLSNSVKECNTKLIDDMTNSKVDYGVVCIRSDITFEDYYNNLKKSWEDTINNFVNNPNKCSGNIQSILFLTELFQKAKQYDLSKLDTNIRQFDIDKLKQTGLNNEIQNKLMEIAVDMINNPNDKYFSMTPNMTTTLKNLATIFSQNCECQLMDIFSFIIDKYKSKYSIKYKDKTKQEQIEIFRNEFETIQKTISLFASDKPSEELKGGNILNLSLIDFSLERELDKLIPNELGSLKEFFMKVIVSYFDKLHPIIWAQIFRSMINNVFIELPLTPDELFSFASKHLLLNAGPFILKMLQMIRPVLTDEIARKYNLTKLTYPLMEKDQVELILRKIMNNYEMTKITYNKSASVGHVCIGHDAKDVNNKFVIKIIKPLAITQSCWEYSVLGNIFKNGTCEDSFIKNTLRANGAEMNVSSEIANLIEGHEAYTSNYKKEFGIDIEAKLTTIEYLRRLNGANEDLIKDDTWFAFGMTLAPGIPVADLVENSELMKDTKYRANLHRCLDILVSRFFYTLISSGFYHGDLHAGNIFYSYKMKQLTMIDFGAVGRLDLFKGDETTHKLIHVIIKSIYYDYGGVLDLLTEILNKRCSDDPKTLIDMKSQKYIQFRLELTKHKVRNIINSEKERKDYKQYIKTFNSNNRVNDEKENVKIILKSIDTSYTKNESKKDKSIYDYLDQKELPKEIIIENRDELPVYKEMLGKSESVTFAKIMEMIIKFYADSGINVAIKFAELNEIQKAYALLLGVLAKTGYSSYRMNLAIETGVLTWHHLPKVVNVATTYNLIKYYWNESSKFKRDTELIMKEYSKHK